MKHDFTRLNCRIRALKLAKAAGYQGLRYLGTSGGNHVLRDAQGRAVGVDLVVGGVCLYVGIPPKVTPW